MVVYDLTSLQEPADFRLSHEQQAVGRIATPESAHRRQCQQDIAQRAGVNQQH